MCNLNKEVCKQIYQGDFEVYKGAVSWRKATPPSCLNFCWSLDKLQHIAILLFYTMVYEMAGDFSDGNPQCY